MKASYTGILGHAASVSRDPSAAKALLMFQQHLQELGRRYYAGDVKVVDEFLQLYSVAPSERADAIFDQAHPDPDTVTAAEAMLAIPIDLRSRLLEAHDFSHFSSEAAGALPQSVLADLRKLCDLMRVESKTAGITHQQAPTAAQAAQPAAELTATRSSPSATLAHQ